MPRHKNLIAKGDRKARGDILTHKHHTQEHKRNRSREHVPWMNI
jgi:hypothetical protein